LTFLITVISPFQIVACLTFFILSLTTTSLIQKICANIAKFKLFLKIMIREILQ